jgi:hypothetical protein
MTGEELKKFQNNKYKIISELFKLMKIAKEENDEKDLFILGKVIPLVEMAKSYEDINIFLTTYGLRKAKK